MKFVSAVTLVGLLASSTSAVDPECTKACMNARETVNSAQACREARRSLPRPKVGEICGKAFLTGYNTACGELCNLGYDDGMRSLKESVHEHCRESKTFFPKPLMGNSCVDGYNGAVQGIAQVMKPILEEAETSGGFALLNGKLDAERLAKEEELEAKEAERVMAEAVRLEKEEREILLAEKIKAEKDAEAAKLAEKAAIVAEAEAAKAAEAAKLVEAAKVAEAAEAAKLKAEAEAAEAEAKELAELEAQLALEKLEAEAEAAEAAELAEKMAEVQGSEM